VLNGSTSTDRTNYWELVPREALRLALWMEADRMGWLLPALTDARSRRSGASCSTSAVRTTRTGPYGLAQFTLLETIFPADHPYHWPTIGYPDDLNATTADDCRAFFREHYHPANASLVIAGDVRTDDALRMVDELFGAIPRGPDVVTPPAPAVSARARRIVHEDRVELPRLYLTWPSPALFAPDDAALDLAADLVANGRTSRLYRRLIHDHRVAAELAAGQASREAGGTFQIIASAAPGHTLDELELVIREELTRFASEGPTDADLARGRAQAEAAFVHRCSRSAGSAVRRISSTRTTCTSARRRLR
jgi:zinc protease